MNIGRKPKSSQIDSDWKRVFYKSIGFYVQSIIVGLQEKSSNDIEFNETGQFLLEKIKKFNVKSFPTIKESEIPFDVPKHWVWCRLGEIIEFTTNQNIETKFSPDTLIDYVDIDAIDNKQFKIREVKTKPVSALSSRARRVLKKGFVIYSLVRPYLNNLAIITEERNNFIGSTGFAVFNGIFVNNEYLKFLLLTEFIRNRYLELLSGFNSPSITQEQFVNTLVPLPPLVEQEGIVSFLNDLESNSLKTDGCYFDKDIERKIVNLQDFQLKGSEISTELNHQLALVKELRQAYLREAMQGKLVPQDERDEPAEILLEKIKAEKLVVEKRIKRDKTLLSINAEEMPFEIPSNWIWCRLGETSEITRGKSPQYSETGLFKMLNQKCVRWFSVDKSHAKAIDREWIETVKEDFIVRSGDILVNSTGEGTIGRSAIADSEVDGYIFDSHILKLRSRINQQYVCYFINSDFGQSLVESLKGATSTKQTELGVNNLTHFTIPLPPLAEQERIVSKLGKLMKFCDELEANIRQGIADADQLLQAALRESLEPK